MGYSTSPYQAPRSASFNSTSRMAATTSGNLRPMSMTSTSVRNASQLVSGTEYESLFSGHATMAPSSPTMAKAPSLPGISPLAWKEGEAENNGITVTYTIDRNWTGGLFGHYIYTITYYYNGKVIGTETLDQSWVESLFGGLWGADDAVKKHAQEEAGTLAYGIPIGDVLPLLLFALLFAAVAWKKKNDVKDVV